MKGGIEYGVYVLVLKDLEDQSHFIRHVYGENTFLRSLKNNGSGFEFEGAPVVHVFKGNNMDIQYEKARKYIKELKEKEDSGGLVDKLSEKATNKPK